MPGTGQQKTAFVFAGGGSFGAIQVGMLHSLAAHGIVGDMAFGSSVGAINAAYYAGDPTIDLFLADGAISSNTPVKVAVANGAQRLIILPTGYACARHTPPVGAVANALHALTLLIARQLISELENLAPDIDYYVLPPLCPLDGSPYDFSHTAELIARGIESTNEWIDGGGLTVPRIHTQLGLHKHSH